MRLIRVLLYAAVTLASCSLKAQVADQGKPTEVMILGVFHMANPARDLHDLTVDDVLAPKRQLEIRAIAESLTRFKPTTIAVEWPASLVEERYPKYLAGTLPPSHNEVVQLGFRLAKSAGATAVYGIDADGDFPFERVKNFAGAFGFKPLLDQINSGSEMQQQQKLLDTQGISATLRLLNDPARLQTDNTFYRTMLRIGKGDDQPGADLVASWYHRNLLICANLLQIARPGDRIVVIFGAGHAFLLRQCVQETPGFKLVEPNAYLPQ